MYFKKHFTLAEALALLPTVIGKLETIARIKQQLDAKGYDVFKHQYLGGSGPNGQKFFPNELEELIEIVKDLNDEGIEIKDLDKGLIDFPHLRPNGEEVFLCYKLGESTIVAWHDLSEGFPGRRPLDEL